MKKDDEIETLQMKDKKTKLDVSLLWKDPQNLDCIIILSKKH